MTTLSNQPTLTGEYPLLPVHGQPMTDETTHDLNEFRTQLESVLNRAPNGLDQVLKPVIAKELAACLRNEEPHSRFKWHTAAEALQPLAPIDWIVDRIFSAGSVNLVVGDSKSKKTYAMLDCMVSIAHGANRWLDFPIKQRTVLIIDEESGNRRMKQRLGDIMRGHEADQGLPIHFVTLAGFSPLEIADQIELRTKISETGAQVVLIDALIDILGDIDENDAAEVQQVFHALREIADGMGVCVIIIHHTNKSGGYRGSSAMRGAVDLLLTVESKPNSLDMKFNLEAPRDTEPFEFAAVANFGESIFNLSPNAPSNVPRSGTPHYSVSQKYVISYLESHGPSEITAMCSHADTCNADAARKAVYTLAAKDKIKRINDGGAGAKAVYSLIDGSFNLTSCPPLKGGTGQDRFKI